MSFRTLRTALFVATIAAGLAAPTVGMSATAAPLAQPEPANTESAIQETYSPELISQQSFAVDAGATLSIRVDDADIAVGPSDDGQARVEIFLRSNDMEWARDIVEQMQFEVRAEGGGLAVESRGRRRSWSWRDNRWLSVLVDVRVPARFDFDISTGDGDVALDAFEGRVAIETEDGDISLADLAGPVIRVVTADGDIRGDSLTADEVDIDTSDGDVSIAAVIGRLVAHTSDGDVRIGSLDSESASVRTGDGDVRMEIVRVGSLEVESGDGDISIRAPASLQADVDLRAEDVTVDFEVAGRLSSGRVRGTINGGGPIFRIETNDGSVVLVQSR